MLEDFLREKKLFDRDGDDAAANDLPPIPPGLHEDTDALRQAIADKKVSAKHAEGASAFTEEQIARASLMRPPDKSMAVDETLPGIIPCPPDPFLY